MAPAVNQRGYDVIARTPEGAVERISVKTVTTSKTALFSQGTFSEAQRVRILLIDYKDGEVSIKTLVDRPASEILPLCRPNGTKLSYALGNGTPRSQTFDRGEPIAEAVYRDTLVKLHSMGSVSVWRGGTEVASARPVLEEIARQVGVPPLNGAGNKKNTRTLGNDVMAALGAVTLLPAGHSTDTKTPPLSSDVLEPDMRHVPRPIAVESSGVDVLRTRGPDRGIRRGRDQRGEVISQATIGHYVVRMHETRSISVMEGGEEVIPTKPALRELAKAMGIPLDNGAGGPKNTQTLGADILKVAPVSEIT
ncbi:hypothetical protein [Asaia sp. VD9]|uniref:hypothetical protein n=1 Tax=Asaia sp. VD9 TaxID=3081235 RepID=UPI003018291B